jgi:hypothetical protein
VLLHLVDRAGQQLHLILGGWGLRFQGLDFRV